MPTFDRTETTEISQQDRSRSIADIASEIWHSNHLLKPPQVGDRTEKMFSREQAFIDFNDPVLIASSPLENTDSGRYSMDAVGEKAARSAKALTNLTGTEWGGLLYTTKDDKWHATPPITNFESVHVNPDNASRLIPAWISESKAESKVDYHSHPGVQPAEHLIEGPRVIQVEPGKACYVASHNPEPEGNQNPFGTHFSFGDAYTCNVNNRPSYLGIPGDKVKKLTPFLANVNPGEFSINIFPIDKEGNELRSVLNALPWAGHETFLEKK